MVQQSTNNIFENVYKFNGKELDEQTGYYYYGARYYDPATSIFLSVDPLAEQFPGWNPYHYVHNNPINLIDPTGMSADGWRENKETGEVKFDESYTSGNTDSDVYTYFDAGTIGDGRTMYNADGTHEPIKGGTTGCVDCHHTANIGNLDLSDSSPYLQGSLNIAGGFLGATAASAYMIGTEGVGVAFGGATALTLSIGQMSIGVSQIGNAWVGGSNQALENSNSLLGYGARVMNSPYSDMVDSASGLLGGSLSGGVIRGVFNNSRNIMNGKNSVKSAYEIYDSSKSAYDTQKAIKEYRAIYNEGKRK